MTPTFCPFCNGVLPALTSAPMGDKFPCPRCGEPIPAARWHVDTAIASGPPTAPAPIGAERPNVPGTRKTLLVILTIMVTMAIIGLSYALWTTKLRRSRDPKMSLDPVTIRRPLELPGLTYLPRENHVIVGLHLAEWLDDKKVGKSLLEEPRPAPLDWIVKQLPRMTGMKLEEIDHVVLAASFDKPQVVMVVQTRRPYDLSKIVESIHPTQSGLHQDHPLYHFAFHPAAPAMLWCVEKKTLVCVIRLDEPKSEHLHGLSTTPRKLEDLLSGPLHEALKERLPKQNFLWAVGRVDQLGILKEMLLFAPGARTYVEAIKDLKVFALGLEPIEGLTLTGYFQMTDAKAAAKFKTLLEGVKIEGAKSQKVEAPPADEEQWLTWQVRADVAVLREWLNKGKGAKN